MDSTSTTNSSLPRVQYVGNGSQTVFRFLFPVFAYGDLEVFLNADPQRSGYLLHGLGSADGGSVRFNDPPAAGASVVLLRSVSMENVAPSPTASPAPAGISAGEVPASAILRSDMDPDVALIVTRQDDGDVTLCLGMWPRGVPYTLAGTGGKSAAVEFCTGPGGGSKHHRTGKALRDLIVAMDADASAAGLLPDEGRSRPAACTGCKHHRPLPADDCGLVGRCFAESSTRRPVWCPLDAQGAAQKARTYSIRIAPEMTDAEINAAAEAAMGNAPADEREG